MRTVAEAKAGDSEVEFIADFIDVTQLPDGSFMYEALGALLVHTGQGVQTVEGVRFTFDEHPGDGLVKPPL